MLSGSTASHPLLAAIWILAAMIDLTLVLLMSIHFSSGHPTMPLPRSDGWNWFASGRYGS